MTKKIDGRCFKNMLEYGMRNLNIHRTLINHINVFPVPDGDTGTNMVVTIKNGLSAINDTITNLTSVSTKFAKSIVTGARGNSGVIASQFLKGMSETLSSFEYADAETFIRGLEHGVKCAYSSVSEPVEGTILTVIKSATEAARRECGPDSEIDAVIDTFIKHAKVTLEQTPELLPQLKDAGVVDSGGSGIVYFFEGMKKYLDGEEITSSEPEPETEPGGACAVDYSVYNRKSSFPYGYCTELLIQLLDGSEDFSYEQFKKQLEALGSSIVTSLDDDKVKVHIHSFHPEMVLGFCHRYGEFLSLKIENMTVQHTETSPKIVFSKDKKSDNLAVVAMARTKKLQTLFLEMGADAVILQENGVTEEDLTDTLGSLQAKTVFIFPNDEEAKAISEKVRETYRGAVVTVIDSRNAADCYASLPMIDYDESDTERSAGVVRKTIRSISTIAVRREKDPSDSSAAPFTAFDGQDEIASGDSLPEILGAVFAKAASLCDSGVATVFTGRQADAESVENALREVITDEMDLEVNVVETDETSYDVLISLE